MRWDRDLADAFEALLWWVLLPMVCLAGLVFIPQDVGPSWAARAGQGVTGTFTAEHESCGRYTCHWSGSFTSDDGSIHREDVLIGSGAPDLSLGSTTPAVDTGDRAVVFPPSGGWDWLLTALLLLAAVVYLVVWSLALGRRWLAHRERRSRAAEAATVCLR